MAQAPQRPFFFGKPGQAGLSSRAPIRLFSARRELRLYPTMRQFTNKQLLSSNPSHEKSPLIVTLDLIMNLCAFTTKHTTTPAMQTLRRPNTAKHSYRTVRSFIADPESIDRARRRQCGTCSRLLTRLRCSTPRRRSHDGQDHYLGRADAHLTTR